MQTIDTLTRDESTQLDRADTVDADESHIVRGLD